MAEAAGLAISVVGLAALFDCCVELLNHISTVKSFDRDSKILNTKLDVEKTLLLHWATRVRLVKEECDSRLDQEDLRKLIREVLDSIRVLLSDSELLQHRYGLKEVQNANGVEISSLLSKLSLKAFANDMERMKLTMGWQIARRELKISRPRKLVWAICDRRKFSDLVSELSYFVAKLNELVPADQIEMIRLMSRDFDELEDIEDLNLISEAALEQQPPKADIARLARTKSAEVRILNALWFRTMNARRDDIDIADPKTFQWALDPTAFTECDDLSSFLGYDAGIYWVYGKPGAGKSTLMKHICYHEKTDELLQQWAGALPLSKASFFFKALGKAEQKSQEGLHRALLFKILKPARSLIPELLPSVWKEVYGSKQPVVLPSEGEIKYAFSTLAKLTPRRHKWCLFIDGLDEYEGNHAAAIALFKQLTINPDIKIILSSRPLPICVQAFSAQPKLQLQDLTRNDIETYVGNAISSHPHMQLLREDQPELADGLRTEIVNKASGVFLWVVLACRSIQIGLDNADSISELQSRLNELPEDLANLFQHILQKIEKRYRDQAAKLLRLQYHSQLLTRAAPLPALGLAILAEQNMNVGAALKVGQLNFREQHAKCAILMSKLRSRCLGLLEIKSRKLVVAHVPNNIHNPLNSTVEFMHRTVFDFLKEPGVLDLDCVDPHDEHFDANALLSFISLRTLKIGGTTLTYGQESYLQDTLRYAQHSTYNGDAIAQILSEVFPLVMTLPKTQFRPNLQDQSPTADQAQSHLSEIDRSQGGLLLAAELGLTHALTVSAQFRLAEDPPTTAYSYPLLYHVIRRPLTSRLAPVNPETLGLSLSLGADPNESFQSISGLATTPWLYWLEYIGRRANCHGLISNAKATEAFVSAGADIHVADQYFGKPFREVVEELIDREMRDVVGASTRRASQRRLFGLLMAIDRRLGHSVGDSRSESGMGKERTIRKKRSRSSSQFRRCRRRRRDEAPDAALA